MVYVGIYLVLLGSSALGVIESCKVLRNRHHLPPPVELGAFVYLVWNLVLMLIMLASLGMAITGEL